MYIITVIPLTRSKVAGSLSYFTPNELVKGSVVTVPLRSKTIHAIVTDCKPGETMKSEIKNASFQIRKLSKVKSDVFFPPSFIDSCRLLAEYYATNTGAIIDSIVNNSVMDNISKISAALPLQASFISGAPSVGETYIVQGDENDRISSWRSLIRQEFAKKKSIAFYLPTMEEVRQFHSSLEKGIEDYIFMLHGGLTEKKVVDTWTKIHEADHPIVIVATGSFSVLPRGDIESVVIERENSRGWIGQKMPYLDQRHAIEFIARRQRQNVYRGDIMVTTESLKRLEDETAGEGSPFKWRSVSDSKDILIDMRKDKVAVVSSEEKPESEDNEDLPMNFKILSAELENLIRQNKEESTHLFIMTARRGISPTTICSDCETIVTCHQCSAPIVLHKSKQSGRNFFMCHKCGSQRSASEICKKCGSWRLTPLGIGIERVYQEIKEKFPDVDVIKIDLDTTKTDKQVDLAMAEFRQKPGSILLGTETALNHINEKVEYVAVVSLDSFFALPDFRIEEKIMYALVRLRSLAIRSLLVQTRKPEEKVFEYGCKGNLSDFYRKTLEERKKFKYPPFSLLIKITLEGNKEKIAGEMANIQEQLTPYEIDIFPAFTATIKGKSLIHGLVKAETHSWPDPNLVEKLRNLPPSVSVKINPESLL